jgi:hypothetical protein
MPSKLKKAKKDIGQAAIDELIRKYKGKHAKNRASEKVDFMEDAQPQYGILPIPALGALFYDWGITIVLVEEGGDNRGVVEPPQGATPLFYVQSPFTHRVNSLKSDEG